MYNQPTHRRKPSTVSRVYNISAKVVNGSDKKASPACHGEAFCLNLSQQIQVPITLTSPPLKTHKFKNCKSPQKSLPSLPKMPIFPEVGKDFAPSDIVPYPSLPTLPKIAFFVRFG